MPACIPETKKPSIRANNTNKTETIKQTKMLALVCNLETIARICVLVSGFPLAFAELPVSTSGAAHCVYVQLWIFLSGVEFLLGIHICELYVSMGLPRLLTSNHFAYKKSSCLSSTIEASCTHCTSTACLFVSLCCNISSVIRHDYDAEGVWL